MINIKIISQIFAKRIMCMVGTDMLGGDFGLAINAESEPHELTIPHVYKEVYGVYLTIHRVLGFLKLLHYRQEDSTLRPPKTN